MAGVYSSLFLFLIFRFLLLNSVVLGKEISYDKNFKKRAAGGPSEPCKESPLTVQEKNYLVWLHTSLRENITNGNIPKPFYMKRLSWNENLGKIAQRWAEKCTMTRNANLKMGNQAVGQLISVVDERKVKNMKDLFHEWEEGVRKLTPEVIENYKKPQPGEFDYEPAAQLLWWNTSQMGCGRSSFKTLNCTGEKKNNCVKNGVVQLVCNYFPAGNKEGNPVYISKSNQHLICNYDKKHESCTQEKEEIEKKPPQKNNNNRISPIDRIRNRMIQLWPAAGRGISLKAKWESLCIFVLLFLIV